MADATNALDTLGEILPRDPGRDAIHLATYAVSSDERLFPGQHIGFVGDKVSAKAPKHIGIVDPFLPTGANPGEMFWMLLYPRTITSLRHVWTHPEFTAEAIAQSMEMEMDPNAKSRAWLANLADSVGISYRRLMEGAEDWRASQRSGGWGEYIIGGSEMEGNSVPDEFWTHYEVMTGESVPEKERGSFFSCSC